MSDFWDAWLRTLVVMSVLSHSTFIEDWNIDKGSSRFSPIIFSERAM